MNLLAFRQFFRTHSGRHDLVNADGSDNGANVLINAASIYLDRLVDMPPAIGRVFKDIVAGDYLVTFEYCRSIHEVWCVGPTDGSGCNMTRLPLTKRTQQELRGVDPLTLENAYVEFPSSITKARPTDYTPAQLRLVPDSSGATGGISGFMDVMADCTYAFDGVYFMPPADTTYTIEVVGHFYHLPLVNDTDISFWTYRHYMALYMATMREVEIIYRNTAGVNDWEASINKFVISLDMDGVKQESTDVTEMEG